MLHFMDQHILQGLPHLFKFLAMPLESVSYIILPTLASVHVFHIKFALKWIMAFVIKGKDILPTDSFKYGISLI